MIADTSALVAVLRREDGHGPILDALLAEAGLIPAPVPVGFARVAAGPGNAPDREAAALVAALLDGRAAVLPFGAAAARHAAEANEAHGRGDGRCGALDVLDLMVLGCARAAGRAILCTSRDFAAAGAALHPASRPW